MTATAPDARRSRPRLSPVTIVRAAPWDVLATVALVITALIFVVQLPGLIDRSDRVGGLLVWQTYVAVGLLLATAASRSLVGLRAAVSYFLVGFYGVVGLVQLLGVPLDLVMDLDSTFSSIAVAPAIEEAAKALPLVVFVALASRNRLRAPSAAGIGLLGFAVGCGFSLFENSLTAVGRGAGGLTLNPFSFLWPTVFFEDGRVILVHSGWTALVGVGLGIAWMIGRRAGWLLPVGALIIVMYDHASANAFVDGNSAPWVATLNGWLPFILLVVGFGVALVLDARALREGARRDRAFRRPSLGQVTGLASAGTGSHPIAATTYLRALNGAHLLMGRRGRTGRLDRVDPGLAHQLEALRIRAGIAVPDRSTDGSAAGTPSSPEPVIASAGPTTDQSPAPDANPPAWHADPLGRHEQRWWDGTGWTDHVADAGATSSDPVG